MNRADRGLTLLLFWLAVSPSGSDAQVSTEVWPSDRELTEAGVLGAAQRIQVLETRIYGASTIPADVVRRVGRVRNGDYVDTINPGEVVQRVRKKYQEYGFESVHVEFKLTPSSSAFWNIAEISIQEGYQSKIREVGVEGGFFQKISLRYQNA